MDVHGLANTESRSHNSTEANEDKSAQVRQKNLCAQAVLDNNKLCKPLKASQN